MLVCSFKFESVSKWHSNSMVKFSILPIQKGHRKKEIPSLLIVEIQVTKKIGKDIRCPGKITGVYRKID